MKTIKKLCAFFMLISISASASARVLTDSLGLPGDNLDLYGVLELFKKSANPEEFEKALNQQDSKLNNLDLNGDNKIDYIHVIDRTEKDIHTLVLQVDVNETEKQDVAVIEIEKKGEGTAHLQIVGDEDLYGKDYIIEPVDESAAKAPVTTDNTTENHTTVIVNVWSWPGVYYMYRPSYVVWVSPWGWSHYPGWWSPWRPVYWGVYHPYWYPYHSYHHRVYVYRAPAAHNFYYGHRAYSKTVYQRRNAEPVRGREQQRVRRTTERVRVTEQPSNKPRGRVSGTANPRKQQAVPRSQSRQNQAPHQRGGGGRRK